METKYRKARQKKPFPEQNSERWKNINNNKNNRKKAISTLFFFLINGLGNEQRYVRDVLMLPTFTESILRHILVFIYVVLNILRPHPPLPPSVFWGHVISQTF